VASPASSAAFASLNYGASQALGGHGAAGTDTTGTTGTTGTSNQTSNTSGGQTQPYSPSTDLTAGQDKNYTDWFQNNDQTGQQIQQLAQQQAAQGNRKAAYLASMSGGNGGYFQSGQIAAGIAGQNMMQQGLLQNAQARGQIYGDKASSLASLGLNAQQYGNSLGLQHDSQSFTKEQAGGGASQSAAAGNFTTLDSQIKDGHPHWGPNSDANRDWDN
jgi:hypothetical protein